MTLSINTLRRLGTTLALAAAIAGAAAPAALANHQDVGVTEALREIRGTAPTSDAVDRYLIDVPVIRDGAQDAQLVPVHPEGEIGDGLRAGDAG